MDGPTQSETLSPTELGRKHPLAECEKCPLQSARYVPTWKPSNPRLSVVGEAPGEQEAYRGAPFLGPSGKLLFSVLGAFNVKREEVLLTNVVSCRPPDNATPPAAAIAACRGRLLSELGDAGVDIIAVGGTASQAVADDTRNITAARVGPPKQAVRSLRDAGISKVIPTWHPAYCLRNPDAFPAMVSDIGKAFRKTWKPWKEPAWKYFDEPPLAIAALQALMQWQDKEQQYELVVDIECGIEKDVVFDHPNMYDMLCVGLAYTRGKAIVIGEEAFKDEKVRELLGKLLERSKLICQNGKFDLAGLYKYYKKPKLWFDTMLAHYALDERPGAAHNLDTLGQELLGAPNWKGVVSRYIPKGGNYANIPREILYKYCALDCAVTWDLKDLLVEDLARASKPENWPYKDVPYRSPRDVHDFLVAASNQLMYLELNGIKVDLDYSWELGKEYQAYLDTLEADLDALVNKDTKGETTFINPRSPQQVKAYLNSHPGVRVEKTDKPVLEMLQKRIDPESDLGLFLAHLLKHRKEQKKMSTYVKGIRRRVRSGRVFTTYLLHGSTSGRLASRNPNLQNIMRDKRIRNQFVVTQEDNVFVHCDYKQAEGRVIAWLARDEYLRAVFADPEQDLFSALGARLYNMDPADLDKERRIRVKAYFYGLGYGREAYSIAQEYELPVRTVERDLVNFFDMMGAVRPWQQSIKKQVHTKQFLISPFGRRRRFPLITEQNRKDVEKEALSYLPQSTASDICLGAAIELRPMLRGKAFIRLTIHDALVAECHKSKADEVGEMMREVMVRKAEELQTYVPFGVDITTGQRWGEL